MTKIIKSSFQSICSYMEAVGRARAASELTRLGYTEEAKRLMTNV